MGRAPPAPACRCTQEAVKPEPGADREAEIGAGPCSDAPPRADVTQQWRLGGQLSQPIPQGHPAGLPGCVARNGDSPVHSCAQPWDSASGSVTGRTKGEVPLPWASAFHSAMTPRTVVSALDPTVCSGAGPPRWPCPRVLGTVLSVPHGKTITHSIWTPTTHRHVFHEVQRGDFPRGLTVRTSVFPVWLLR